MSKNLLFPLALAVILGGLSAWLEGVSTIEVQEVKLNPTEPQYSLQGLSGKRFDETGSLKEHLQASQAWQLPDQKDVFLDNAHLQTYQQGNLQYTVESEKARYELKNKHIYLETGVILTKAEDENRPAAQVLTDSITVDTVAQTAQSDAPIRFNYGQSHGSADGFFYDNKSGKLDLPSNVKALIYNVKTND